MSKLCYVCSACEIWLEMNNKRLHNIMLNDYYPKSVILRL